MFKFSAWWVGLSPKQAAAAMLNPADEAAHVAASQAAPVTARFMSQVMAQPRAHETADEAAEQVASPARQATAPDHGGTRARIAQAAQGAEAAQAAPLDLAALVGVEGWARLPPAVRRRFAAGHAATVYEGRMDLACSRVGRVYAALASLFGSPLTAARTQALPTRVRVHGDGRGGVVWERCFAARDGIAAQTVRSTKLRGAAGGLIERTDGGLAMNLDVFEDQGALVFQSRSYFFDLFGWYLPVPAWLTPGTCRVEHHDLGPGRFRFTLVMDHPRWGRCFEQTGVFIDPDGSVE